MFVNPEDVVPRTKSIKIVVRLGFKNLIRDLGTYLFKIHGNRLASFAVSMYGLYLGQ